MYTRAGRDRSVSPPEQSAMFMSDSVLLHSSSSAAPFARISNSASREPVKMRLLQPPKLPMRTISSCRFRAVTTHRLASTACSSLAANANEWQLPAPSSRTRRLSCSTKQRQHSIPNPNCRSVKPWNISARVALLLSSHTDFIRCRMPTASTWSKTDAQSKSGRHEELLRAGGRYASFYRLQLKQQEARSPIAAIAVP